MISVYQLKPKFQELLTPWAEFLNDKKITANTVTLASIVLSAVIGSLFIFSFDFKFALLLIPLGLFFRMALNALDGLMARNFNMQSRQGEILNELGDIISDLMIICPLVFIPNIPAIIIGLFAILTIINEFTGLLGKASGGQRRYEGPMGKSDRTLVIGLFCLLYFFFPGIVNLAPYIFICVCLLLIWSTIIRLDKMLSENIETH